MTLVLVLPLRLASVLNVREHHMGRASRARDHRAVTRMSVCAALPTSGLQGAMRLRVVLTRIGPKALDGDNLAASAKSVRDGVADALGVDDADPRVSWAYAQRRATQEDRPNTCGLRHARYGVEIWIGAEEGAAA